MKVKTITCHDVYNVGASLQAYALAKYIKKLGHDVQIIDYKPDYLVHFRLLGVGNSKYNKPFLREAYQLAKLPGRLKARLSKRKKEYDTFTKEYLPTTEKHYTSNDELKANPPEADIYIAGSDQIWNTFFNNGKDPAFYLDFAPEESVKASYAASFSLENIPDEYRQFVTEKLQNLDYISVRETSGVEIINNLGISSSVQVLDPIFLLDKNDWSKVEKNINNVGPYILVYDFDKNPSIKDFALKKAKENKWKIYSVLPLDYCDKCFDQEGPQAFINLIHNAEYVVSNSFHATAFSILYEKQFKVFDRNESINTRMHDLLSSVGIDSANDIITESDWNKIRDNLNKQILFSKEYIDKVLSGAREKIEKENLICD